MSHEIIDCEISPSSKAKCHHCEKKLQKGTPRIYFNMNWKRKIKQKFKWKNKGELIPWTIQIKRSICYECAELILNYNIDTQKKELSRLKLIKRKFKEKMKNPKIQETIRNNEIIEELEKQ